MGWTSKPLQDHVIQCYECDGDGESETGACEECFGTGIREVDADSFAPDTGKEADGIA
jgi:DnaJ-class molecular chaperone